ncbi:EXPANSIN L1, expansin-like A1 [Hibiscus trionum]|uniref:EXPANSIN L1, expansin-like A1 n=1 Tax=Hibiscus trionum TaxID=183268 RepID=A0A9W7JH34_HIBTR|nr:EXPANSIN L1, expansin-like A1 [Hibiscus trionum]
MAHFVWLLFLLLSSATACDRCVHKSKAAFFSTDSPLASGACGYGPLALNLGGGRLAAGVSSLYKQGVGCGACFQIRCKDPKLCSKTGTTVTLTDQSSSGQTAFVLSSKAFMAMANPSMVRDILKLGIVDVEYKRVPCEYKNQNIAVRVEDSSKNPYYLAIKLLYQGGQTDIFSINVAQVGSPKWIFMQRNHGAVWDTSTVPKGALDFRFAVTHGQDRKWIWAKNVLPADWKPGQIYNTKVQFTAIAQENCSPCDYGTW